MIKVKDGYGKFITDYKGDVARVLLSNGGDLQYSETSVASTLVQRNSSGLITSTVTGVAPFVVSSTMVNSNLNADLLDGYNVEGLFETLGSTKDVNLTVQIGRTNKTINDLYATYDSEGDNIVGKYVTLSTNQTIDGIKTFSKQAHFTITDSSPFTVASSVLVEKLNAEQLGGKKLNELFTNFANVSDKKVNITIGGVSKDLYIDYSKTAHLVENSLTLKSGTTTIATFDGSAEKTINFEQGEGISLTASANNLKIQNEGVLSVTTGDLDGTIKVNTGGTSVNVPVKGWSGTGFIKGSGTIKHLALFSGTDTIENGPEISEGLKFLRQDGTWQRAGVEIVSSVNELDLSAEQGNIAVVKTNETITESYSFTESYYNDANAKPVRNLKFTDHPMEEMYSKFQNFGTAYEESNNLQIRLAIILFSTKNGLNDFINKVSNNNEPVLILMVCAIKQIDTNANWLYISALIGVGDSSEEFAIYCNRDIDFTEAENTIPFGVTVYHEGMNILNSYLLSYSLYQGVVVDLMTPELTASELSTQQIEVLDSIFGYNITEHRNTNDLYIKESEDEWKNFVVNNLIDGGIDKALSAEMGKLLQGDVLNSIKFKGYVNVDETEDMRRLYNELNYNEVCLVIPSNKLYTGSSSITQDSYTSWIDSALNGTPIFIGEPLREMDMSGLNMNPLSWVTSKNMGELRTYLALDEYSPVCFCPDVILVAKMRVQVKPILSNATDTGSILNLMPDDLMVTGCISKIIRWSGGDFVEANKENLLNLIDNNTIPILSYSPILWLNNNYTNVSYMLSNYRQALTNKYARDYDMDLAYDTGIISFTSKCTSGLPGTGHPIGEWYTVVVETSDDKDANGYHFIRQTAFYRNTGGSVLDQTKLKNSVWVRYMFGIKGGSNSLTSKTVSPWIEVSNSYLNANQMASYHGVIDEIDYWHYNPDDALKQGIYPTCGNEFVFDSKGNTVFTLGGFCTVIVINSTLPDSTGYSTVEQTAYGRDGDNGKIYKRILFIHDTESTISGNWTRIDSCDRETENYTRYGWGIDVNTNAIYTGACAYTPAVIDGIDGNWTIFVNRTVDTDGDGTNGYYHLTQTAYYRDGIANIPSGTKFERMGWYKIEGRDSENNPNIVDLNFTPWMSTYKFVTVDTLSEFVTFDALESLYYATNDYVDQKVAGITGGTVVSWGTTSNNTSPLTVAGTSKTVSLSGHTHSYAPIAHASSATTYGVATTANYGHVKISNGDCNTVASANGLAAGMNHTHGNYATTTALASYLPLAGGNLTGPVTSTSTITATAFYQSSDRNLKDNIQLLQQDILDKIYNTNEVTFTWKSTGERAYGYIAQDMLSISEDLIRVENDGHLVLDYNSVLVLQVAALKQKIANLEERIQKLERSSN